MLNKANGPERDHAEKGGDSPAPAAEGGPACAYFAADEAEEGRGDESDQEDEKEDGLEDEDERAGVPARVERKEGAEAVVVGPVQQEVTKQGDEGEAVEQSAQRMGALGGLLEVARRVRQRWKSQIAPTTIAASNGMPEEGVGPSAMMLKGSDGAFDGPENVEVGRFGSERHGNGGVGCFAVEPGSGEAGSGHQVGYGFHSVWVMPSPRLACWWNRF